MHDQHTNETQAAGTNASGLVYYTWGQLFSYSGTPLAGSSNGALSPRNLTFFRTDQSQLTIMPDAMVGGERYLLSLKVQRTRRSQWQMLRAAASPRTALARAHNRCSKGGDVPDARAQMADTHTSKLAHATNKRAQSMQRWQPTRWRAPRTRMRASSSFWRRSPACWRR